MTPIKEKLLSKEPVFLHIFTGIFDVISEFESSVSLSQKEYAYTEEEYISSLPKSVQGRNYEHAVKWWRGNKARMKELLESTWAKKKVLFASYSVDNYAGDTWVLFEENGVLFEVEGSHCSCYGLEGQWEPSEITLEQLQFRLLNSKTFGNQDYTGNVFRAQLEEFLRNEEE